MSVGWINIPVDPEDSDRIAYLLVLHGWRQTSRRWGLLARLPDGRTGKEALASVGEHEQRMAERLAEADAASQFLRMYAKPPNKIRVSHRVLDAFRRMGGKTA